MEYPKNGSIVIVDDKYEEVEGLIRVFSSKGIPITYFNGEIDKLISLNGTRIVFLDLDLKLGTRDSEEQDIISNVFANLKKIIPKNNGGYILVIWSSRESELGEKVENEIKQRQEEKAPLLNEYPLGIVRISKHDVAILKDGKFTFNLEDIETKINGLVSNNNILNLIAYWENKVTEASKNVVSHFYEITQTEDKQKLLLTLFADSSSPEGSLDENTIIAPAILPMSVLLSDQLSSKGNAHSLSAIGSELKALLEQKEKIDLESVAGINTFYHLDKEISCNNAPGSVYLYQTYMDDHSCSSQNCSTKWAEDLPAPMLDEIKIKVDKCIKLEKDDENHNVTDTERTQKQKDIEDNIVPVFLEFTPDCDYVQGHRKKLRLIFGLMYPIKVGVKIELSKNKGSYIELPLIQHEGNIYNIVLNLLTITGINEDAFCSMTPIFRMRKELLVDIQQKIASHIARPGFFNMNDYLAK